MPMLFAIGRILFVLIFIISGAYKLYDLGSTAALISQKVVIPGALTDITKQIESAVGMPMPRILAIAVGVVELAGGLGLAFNIATRFASILLMLFTVAAMFYFHDFWNMAGEARNENIIHALKNLSIIGGLLVFFVLGSWRPTAAASDEMEAGTMRY
jgi:putative oxidoreductase